MYELHVRSAHIDTSGSISEENYLSFLKKIGLVENAEQERERLAQAPEGSKAHALSQLPITIEGWPEDLVIELPWAEMGLYDEPHRVVVVPFKYHADSRPEGEEDTAPLPRRRHSGWWDCIVVASTHPSYPVGGHRLSIPGAELARGKKIDIFELQRDATGPVPF
ncbi:hypothetical protein [Streptomyces sp. NPDC052042]|uniref:hypothetical protein n=1 Tax=Streptomyces sp. NPDC052042 TaxID=3365683 RepID=UPI0037D8C157